MEKRQAEPERADIRARHAPNRANRCALSRAQHHRCTAAGFAAVGDPTVPGQPARAIPELAGRREPDSGHRVGWHYGAHQRCSPTAASGQARHLSCRNGRCRGIARKRRAVSRAGNRAKRRLRRIRIRVGYISIQITVAFSGRMGSRNRRTDLRGACATRSRRPECCGLV